MLLSTKMIEWLTIVFFCINIIVDFTFGIGFANTCLIKAFW